MISKLVVAAEVNELCLSENWEFFFESAWGKADGYCSAMLAYLFLSPLVAAWLYPKLTLKEKYSVKEIMAAIGSIFVVLFLLFIALRGPSIYSIDDPTKAMRLILILGRSHTMFCMMYGALIMSCVVVGCVSTIIFLQTLIMKRS